MNVGRALPILWVALAVGCNSPARHATPERLDRGYAALFVGIMGAREQHNQFADELLDGGLPYAVEVIDWTRGPFLFPMNLRAIERNRKEAQAIARRILEYQDRHPGRPVFLVGHSGGAGIILLLLEALPEDRKVTSAIAPATT
jgi:dienelactone hydrolase